MPRQLTPLDPEAVLVIRDVLPNITTLSLPFARFGILKFGGRATIGLPSPPSSSHPPIIPLPKRPSPQIRS